MTVYVSKPNFILRDELNKLSWTKQLKNHTKLVVSDRGNLGVGVTPSAWSTSGTVVKALELGRLGSAVGVNPANGNTSITSNTYYTTGTGWVYANSGSYATRYANQASDGSHTWHVAGTIPGTAGNAIPFTQALTLHASGGLSLGNTTDPGATNLSVTGTITSGKGANVASASTVTLGDGNFFDITGTTTISAITIKPAGTVVYLKFDNTINLQTGAIGNSGAMRLANAVTLVASQYDVLTLISDGTNWWQVAFSAN